MSGSYCKFSIAVNMTDDERSARHVISEKVSGLRSVPEWRCSSSLAFRTVSVGCHSNPSLGIIQAVASDVHRKRVEDRAKKATAVFGGGNSLWNIKEAA